jgi:hypothetical protein
MKRGEKDYDLRLGCVVGLDGHLFTRTAPGIVSATTAFSLAVVDLPHAAASSIFCLIQNV